MFGFGRNQKDRQKLTEGLEWKILLPGIAIGLVAGAGFMLLVLYLLSLR